MRTTPSRPFGRASPWSRRSGASQVRPDARLAIRVGIATGTVVIGELVGQGAAQEHAAFGETPNLAARLQVLAEPGTVVICGTTRRLTAGHFEYCELEPASLKGFADPMREVFPLASVAVT